jgi:hypothetical protein|tara:strand:+ start:1337 stop:1450 length:114 start_codon:yes stop_codon:yes gene_type:complete
MSRARDAPLSFVVSVCNAVHYLAFIAVAAHDIVVAWF